METVRIRDGKKSDPGCLSRIRHAGYNDVSLSKTEYYVTSHPEITTVNRVTDPH
jgi:hypothetical protein